MSLDALPLEAAKAIRTESELTQNEKKEAIALVKKWIEYTEENRVTSDDLYMLRAHLETFAEKISGKKENESAIEIHDVDIRKLTLPDGRPFTEVLKSVTHPDIMTDPRIVVYGGVARAALKMFAQQEVKNADRSLIESEFPISDVDYMIIGNDSLPEIVEKYGGDITGTKIIPDFNNISTYLRAVDLTMNQAVVHNGKLYYTKDAFDDATHGLIRSRGEEKPLFGRDSVRLPDGNVYIFKGGFYRCFIALLRGRGNEIVVSKENLEAEKAHIGRYWLTTLFVKILKMDDVKRRDEAILQWHQIAQDIGSTEATLPATFLKELLDKYPDYSMSVTGGEFDLEAQTRWLVEKLLSRGTESVLQKRQNTGDELPETYTPAHITLRPYEGDSDLTDFWKIINQFQESKTNPDT